MAGSKETTITGERKEKVDLILTSVGEEFSNELSSIVLAIDTLNSKLDSGQNQQISEDTLLEIKKELDDLQSNPFLSSLVEYFGVSKNFSSFIETLRFNKAATAYKELIKNPISKLSENLQARIDLLEDPTIDTIDEVNYLPYEIDGIRLPTRAELHRWVNELMRVCSTLKPPSLFNQHTFEHNPDPTIEDIYKKWVRVQLDVGSLKSKNKLPKELGYEEEILLLSAKIGFYNLYFDAQEPNGANNHAKIMDKILNGNSVQYGPLIGGQDKFDRIMLYYGLTEFKVLNEKGETAPVDGDVTDIIRNKSLEMINGSYKFVCIEGGKFVDRSSIHGFAIGNMGGSRLSELQQAVRTGSFDHEGTKVYVVEKSKVKPEKQDDDDWSGKPLFVLERDPATGTETKYFLHKSHLFKGVESDILRRIPRDKLQRCYDVGPDNAYKTSMRDEVFDHAWNLILFDLLDIAFIRNRAKGSSLGQGNENLTGGSLTVSGHKVACMTDALSYLAATGYVLNNKAEPQDPSIDGILLYKPSCFMTVVNDPNKLIRQKIGSKGPTHPTASKYSPWRVTRFAADTLMYYETIFAEEQITGTSSSVKPIDEIEVDIVPEEPFIKINEESYNDRLFWHFDFINKKRPVEFPSLSMALQKKYVASTGAYYTALGGYMYMRNNLFADLPEKMTEQQIKAKVADWMSNGCGTYKIIRRGAQPDWIRKTTRLYFARLLQAYEKNTFLYDIPFFNKDAGQLESLAFELARPLWDATTVADLSGTSEELQEMKLDLILDLFSFESTKEYLYLPDCDLKAVRDKRGMLAQHLQNDEVAELHKYLTKDCKFKINARFKKYNRHQFIVSYNKRMWKKANVAAAQYRMFYRDYEAVKQAWGLNEKAKPIPPRLLTEKSDKS